ncbi:MAG: cysteine desulfurase [Candidatus Omnitrophica bacterium]|nr:cysteine desulfurase [Candidatus Omnitrophota bacterium]
MESIYLDYNATSPLHPSVRQAMRPFLEEFFGNASSLHTEGRHARVAIEKVRSSLLKSLGDPKGQLAFTSGGTESDNLALQGVAHRLREKGDHLVISAVEHSAVMQTADQLEREGFQVTRVPVDRAGTVELELLERAVTPRTALISVMHANNEVGTIQPVEEIGAIARRRGVLFHTDAVQSFGKVPLDLSRVPVDLATLSAHKLGGPKGAGALYARGGVKLQPMIFGGPHERGLRAGTEAVPAIVGLGAAAEMTLREMGDGTLQRIGRLRDRLEAGLRERVPGVEVNGHPENRLANTLNVSFLGCSGETLLMALDLAGVRVSTGSACLAGSTEPSHVLAAMGLPAERTRGAIRMSVGWGTTEEEIEEALRRIPPVVEQVRRASVP